MFSQGNTPHVGGNPGILECPVVVTHELVLLDLSSTYRLLAPGTADGHDLFTVEGELLLEALRQ